MKIKVLVMLKYPHTSQPRISVREYDRDTSVCRTAWQKSGHEDVRRCGGVMKGDEPTGSSEDMPSLVCSAGFFQTIIPVVWHNCGPITVDSCFPWRKRALTARYRYVAPRDMHYPCRHGYDLAACDTVAVAPRCKKDSKENMSRRTRRRTASF